MVPGSSPCGSLGVSVSCCRPQPEMWMQWTHYTSHTKSAYRKSDGSSFLQVSNDFDSEWICSRATRMWQCQASTPGGTVQGHPHAKGIRETCKVVALGWRMLSIHLSHEHLLELQSKTHRDGNKGNNAAFRSHGSMSHFHIHYLPWMESSLFWHISEKLRTWFSLAAGWPVPCAI